MMSQFYYMYDTARQIHVIQNYISVGITLPIAGWLADTYLGRCKVIRWSMWITWIGSMLNTISSIVAQRVVGYETITKKWMIDCSLKAIAAIGFGGYQANIIQFEIDQLHDASTSSQVITRPILHSRGYSAIGCSHSVLYCSL